MQLGRGPFGSTPLSAALHQGVSGADRTLSDGGASYSYSASGAAAVRITLVAGGASYSYSASGVSKVLVRLTDGTPSYGYSASGTATVGGGTITLSDGGASYSYSASGAAAVQITLVAGGASYSYSAAGVSAVRITLSDGAPAYTYVAAGSVVASSTRTLSDGAPAYTYVAAGELRGPGSTAVGGKPRRVLLAEWLAREALERKLRKRRGQAPRRRPVPVELIEGEPLELIVWDDPTALPAVAVPPALTAQLARALEALTPEQLVYRRCRGRAQYAYVAEGRVRGPLGQRLDDIEEMGEIALVLSLLEDA